MKNKKIFFSNLLIKRRKAKLKNVLLKVEELAKSYDADSHKTIFYIVKIYADNINNNNNLRLIYNMKTCNISTDSFLLDRTRLITNENVIIQLGKMPVVTCIWNSDRQISTLSKVGNEQNIWKEDEINHYCDLFLPLGLTVVYNGNHSANCGIVKSVGKINISPDKCNTSIYDNSDLYDKIYFDGKYYRLTETNVILQKTKFEYGCLFEIGRIIHKYNISFTKLFKSDNSIK